MEISTSCSDESEARIVYVCMRVFTESRGYCKKILRQQGEPGQGAESGGATHSCDGGKQATGAGGNLGPVPLAEAAVLMGGQEGVGDGAWSRNRSAIILG